MKINHGHFLQKDSQDKIDNSRVDSGVTGVLLVNLGTPDSPDPKDVYRYLIEFLTDERVIDLPWLKRQLLVRGVIVPFRYKQSAKSYGVIWGERGSPLKYHSEDLRDKLQQLMGDDYQIELAMRYQSPSIEKALDKLLSHNLKRLVIVPLFPQYASATTSSVLQKVMECLSKKQVIPATTFIQNFYDHPGFINALSTLGKRYPLADYDHVLFSFHGLPEKHLTKANPHDYCLKQKNCCLSICDENKDCYSSQCHATAQKLCEALEINPAKTTICFQSRLGKDPWKRPYTSATIKELAAKGAKRVLVFCPAFVADCLETVYEISIEENEEFRKLGGEKLELVTGLNSELVWVEALQQIILDHLPASQTIIQEQVSTLRF